MERVNGEMDLSQRVAAPDRWEGDRLAQFKSQRVHERAEFYGMNS
ncbi:hypothetical protein [Halocatena pleomorpha]|nr:hypothetical protein [Halocatena pleomorpha]